jgi:hypothetical protein
MLIFTFSDTNGSVIHTFRQAPTTDCPGGCCFDAAVADFRTLYPHFVPGQSGVIITIRGQ